MIRNTIDYVYGVSEEFRITLRLAVYVYAVDRVAMTLKMRGIYA